MRGFAICGWIALLALAGCGSSQQSPTEVQEAFAEEGLVIDSPFDMSGKTTAALIPSGPDDVQTWYTVEVLASSAEASMRESLLKDLQNRAVSDFDRKAFIRRDNVLVTFEESADPSDVAKLQGALERLD